MLWGFGFKKLEAGTLQETTCCIEVLLFEASPLKTCSKEESHST